MKNFRLFKFNYIMSYITPVLIKTEPLVSKKAKIKRGKLRIDKTYKKIIMGR